MEREQRQSIISLIKKEWANDIQNITDVALLKEQSEYYVNILEQVDLLHETTDKEDTDKYETTSDSSVITEQHNNIYTLKRALFGGYGFKDDVYDDVFVPEQVIRKQVLEHGDRFIYKKDGVARGRDYFEKLDDMPKDTSLKPNNIIDYEYAYVEFDDTLNQYVVREYLSDGVKETMAPCLIHEHDIEKFELRVGDIVNVARWPEKSIFRLRWKYNSDVILPTPPTRKPTFYKEKNEVDNDIDQCFKGLTVGVVGSETFINNYIEEVESKGGEVHHTDSDIKDYISNVVTSSNVVVIPITQTSHAKAEAAKEIAKRYDKPYIILKTNGRTNFVNQIKETMNIV